MSTHPVDPEDARGAEEGPAGAEPAQIVFDLFVAALKKEITPKQASELVAQGELVQAVTPGDIPFLARALANVEEAGEAKITEFFADLLTHLADALQTY